MTKEQLIALGLTEEQATKASEASLFDTVSPTGGGVNTEIFLY